MKILLISAGTSESGATERAVLEAKNALLISGAEVDVFYLREHTVAACCGCGACRTKEGCRIEDEATRLSKRLYLYDGFIFLTPTHFGGAHGGLKSLMGRLFYSKKGDFKNKPCGAVATSRRGGNMAALDEIQRFFYFAEAICVSGNYPAILHGTSLAEAQEDKEGLQSIRTLAKKLVWCAKCFETSRRLGILPPTDEEKLKTPFIR